MLRQGETIAGVRWLAGLAILLSGAAGADELERHVAAQKALIDTPTRPMVQRERLALELAATLDRDAQAAESAERARRRWGEAVALLDEFDRDEAGHPQADTFKLQASVYDWAISRSWARQAELDPKDEEARGLSVKALDSAIARLRPVVKARAAKDDPVSQNVRFRLAQALADRSEFEPENPAARRAAQVEALEVLEALPREPGLRPFALLLRAELLSRLGREDAARNAVAEAARAKAPAGELLEANVNSLIRQRRFDEAVALVDKAPKDDPRAVRLGVRARLSQREALTEGAERDRAELDAFRRVEALKALGDGDETRAALIALARAVKVPGQPLGSGAWDALIDGALLLGDLDRAAGLAERGAEQAGEDAAARALRYRAGAIRVEAGAFEKADQALTILVEDDGAGDLRARASLLRADARERLAAARPSAESRGAYREALEHHLRDFGDAPGASEARWRLGRMRLESGDPEAAVALWSAIAAGEPRRLDARLAVAALNRGDVESRRLNGDREAIGKAVEAARSFLDETLAEARDPAARAEVQLARATLELVPEAGDPERARQVAESVAREAPGEPLRRRGRQLAAVALAAKGRFVEAGRDLDAAMKGATAGELIVMARLLDALAGAGDSDLIRRRVGALLGRVADALLAERGESLPDLVDAEARLRQARATLFAGDPDGARGAMERWGMPTASIPNELLRDLSDTLARLDAHPMAIVGYRLLTKRTRPGSLPWLEARLNLAESLFRVGQVKDARQLIDGTAILHPDLGGGTLRARFERLRQKLGPG